MSPEKEPLVTWEIVRSEKDLSSRPILSVPFVKSVTISAAFIFVVASEIFPGMIAQVDIIRGSRSILEYIWQPVAKLKDTAFRE